jgi:protein-L-isoaspartate O-methyltransferase
MRMPWVTAAMLRLVKPGWRCLDIGASYGYYTTVLAGLGLGFANEPG